MTHGGRVCRRNERVEAALVQERDEPATELLVVLAARPGTAASVNGPVLGATDQSLLAEIRHLFGRVLLVEANQVVDRLDRRVGPRRQVRGQVGLELVLQHQALAGDLLALAPWLAQRLVAGDLDVVDELGAGRCAGTSSACSKTASVCSL